MVETFVPNGYCSKSFWNASNEENDVPNTTTSHQQPFSVYHLCQPHLRRVKNDHLGASPFCRASVSKSMQLLRKVLQPAINYDIVKVFEKYRLVFREAAESAMENMSREPFSSSSASFNIDSLVAETCQNALNHARSLFTVKEAKNDSKSKLSNNAVPANKITVPATIPTRVLHNGKRRVASPDFPWNKRLKEDDDIVSQRRSLSPVPKQKRYKSSTPVIAPRRYGSPHRNTKDSLRKKIELQWDPARLTTNAEFVMGTKANRALGLGATRGRIYMKHPDLFKYAGDHEDKKWMVKNNCMAATGGKNTFLMMAEDVMHLYDTEYKDSPGTMPEELQFFKLPELVLVKMRTAMINEKKLRIRQLTGISPVQDAPVSRESTPDIPTSYKTPAHRTVRQAAQAAAAAINASSDSSEDQMLRLSSSAIHQQSSSSHMETDSDSDDVM